MIRLLRVLGAFLGLLLLPLASVAGGAYEMLYHEWLLARLTVRRNVIEKLNGGGK